MGQLYFMGYAAARCGAPRSDNPVPPQLPRALQTWFDGHADATEDGRKIKVEPRLDAEFEGR